ncbi:MAG: type II toxin-antitoxin system HipA family toxin, partial [Acidimicrobiales bacterium]
MPSEAPTEAYVWIWLPGESEPVVAGRLETVGAITYFNYGQSYLAREAAIPLYLPELPLVEGRIRPLGELDIAGCISDAGPDAWGQRVILHRHLGNGAGDVAPAMLGPLKYLLESGSDRVGALDFQASPTEYVPRQSNASIVELMQAAQRIEAGVPFSPEIDSALLHGSSIGGARPKALLEDDGRRLIAKFSSATDSYPIVKGESAAMDLARLVGLDVAPVDLVQVMGKDVLLIERFDRVTESGERRAVVSALTILEIGEMFARYATYHDLAEAIRSRFSDGERSLRELFSRIVFNILVGNTDDHARNHSAFWNGADLDLTPAYDICPQPREGGEVAQAMAIGRDGFRLAQLAGCVAAAHL